jgi:glutamate-1-semialdehyde 2,1-aminomutase
MGAFGGKAEIMKTLAPLGAVYQAGTLSGNPLAVTAGLATIREIKASSFYASLEDRCTAMVERVVDEGRKRDFRVSGLAIGGMFGIYFSDLPPRNHAEVQEMDKPLFNRFFHAMLDRGVYLAPAVYEAGFVSAAHTEADIAYTVAAAADTFEALLRT